MILCLFKSVRLTYEFSYAALSSTDLKTRSARTASDEHLLYTPFVRYDGLLTAPFPRAATCATTTQSQNAPTSCPGITIPSPLSDLLLLRFPRSGCGLGNSATDLDALDPSVRLKLIECGTKSSFSVRKACRGLTNSGTS
jgi:hypothetical protein